MLTIFESIRKEFSVNDKGESFCSRRAIARMTGKRLYTIQKLLQSIADQQNVPEVLESFSGYSLTPDQFIPDTLASLIIQHYAFKGSKTAQKYLSAFVAIGLRSAIQEATGWKKPEADYSLFVLPTPMTWVKRFPDELYDEFSRLTGLKWDKKTHQTPHYFAHLTYLFVYKYLPREVYNKIKESQGLIEQNIKIHQFLSEDALVMLNEHLKMVVTVLECATSIKEAKRFLNQRITKQYQLNLFS